jgi:hypothetical protein
MQDLDSRTKSSRRFVVSLRSELRYFSQCDRRQKQQKEPRRAADVPADIRPEKPCDSGNCQHNDRGEPPPTIGRAGPPCTNQDEQRRNDRKEKKDVIEIQA